MSRQGVLLDTDFVIDFLRGDASAVDIIVPLWEKNHAYLSILSVYELYAGMFPAEKEATDHFIAACRLELLTMEIAKNAGIYRSYYRAKGLTLSIVDCLIAETAKAGGYLIATKNLRHFPEKQYLLNY